MIQRLVVNGCSYMHMYADIGQGHKHLAELLQIPQAISLAQSGCNNTRILRTVAKDSYTTAIPTFYVLGMTFISRSELPILRYCNQDPETSFEGRWTNPQNQLYKDQWEEIWTEKDTELFVNLKLKEEMFSLLDRTEDLMYRMLSLINDLESRGHRVLIYQQADTSYFSELDSQRLTLFKTKVNFIQSFSWASILWQHSQGVPIEKQNYNSIYGDAPAEIRHREARQHHVLNKFLTNYIKEYKILE